jgi:hypothetical protein
MNADRDVMRVSTVLLVTVIDLLRLQRPRRRRQQVFSKRWKLLAVDTVLYPRKLQFLSTSLSDRQINVVTDNGVFSRKVAAACLS